MHSSPIGWTRDERVEGAHVLVPVTCEQYILALEMLVEKAAGGLFTLAKSAGIEADSFSINDLRKSFGMPPRPTERDVQDT